MIVSSSSSLDWRREVNKSQTERKKHIHNENCHQAEKLHVWKMCVCACYRNVWISHDIENWLSGYFWAKSNLISLMKNCLHNFHSFLFASKGRKQKIFHISEICRLASTASASISPSHKNKSLICISASLLLICFYDEKLLYEMSASIINVSDLR